MGYDALSDQVEMYKKDRDDWESDMFVFSGEEAKMRDAVDAGVGADEAIQEALSQIERSFERERADLKCRETELREKQEELTDIVSRELEKINDAKKTMDSAAEKRYGRDFNRASDQCEAYIMQLEDMLDQMGEETIKVGDMPPGAPGEDSVDMPRLKDSYVPPREKDRASAAATGNFPEGNSGGFKRIAEPHSPVEDAKATNPNYDPRSVEWSENCQRCVPAYELRRRGYDVKVKPRPVETVKYFLFGERKTATNDDHLSRHPFDAWIPPETIHCSGGQADIEKMMGLWGDGARAEVMVVWEGCHGSGHVFVAEQINGYTHFIDPQSGEDGVAYYFDHCDRSRIYICRTDDKELSEHILDCCC